MSSTSSSAATTTTTMMIDDDGRTPLHHAVMYNGYCGGNKYKLLNATESIAAIKKALALSGIDINHRDNCGQTALHLLLDPPIPRREVDSVLKCLLAGAKEAGHTIDWNLRDKQDYTVLHKVLVRMSSNFGSYGSWKPELSASIIRQLVVEGGAKIVQTVHSNTGDTPLHKAAAMLRHPEVVQILLEHGGKATVNTRNKNMETPLHLCIHPVIVQHLVDAGADIIAKNNDGQTPLHVMKNPDAGKILLKVPGGKECLSLVDNTGNTPLHCFLFDEEGSLQSFHDELECPEMAKLMIEACADVYGANQNGLRPIDCIQMALDYEINDDDIGAISCGLHQIGDFLLAVVPAIHNQVQKQQQAEENKQEEQATTTTTTTTILDPPEEIYGKMMLRILGEFHGRNAEDIFSHINPLLEIGANVNCRDPKTGATALFHLLNSCRTEDDEMVNQEALWSTPFADELEDYEGDREGFALAVLNRLANAATAMAGASNRINVTGVLTKDGTNLFHYVARVGYVSVAERLLELALLSAAPGDDDERPLDLINSPDNKGFTPLHVACQKGHSPLVQWLISKGASCLAVTKTMDKSTEATTTTSKRQESQTPWEMAQQQSGANQLVLAALEDFNMVGPPMKAVALETVRGTTTRSGMLLHNQLLERLHRAGPVGISLFFDLLPSIIHQQQQQQQLASSEDNNNNNNKRAADDADQEAASRKRRQHSDAA